MAQYTITSDDEFSGATVIFDDGTTQVIGSDHQNFLKVVRELISGEATDDELLSLISPFELVYRKLTKLSERVSRKGMRLFFDGDPVANALALHIIKIMDEGAPEEEWQAYIKFWEKAASNPSTRSQDEFFIFVEKNDISITPDGDAILYKSTRTDGTSTYQGYGIVNGVEIENGYIPNSVGAVIEIPRSMVDGNRGIHCSVGLHVGNARYANSYSSRPWIVLVNPRDVVSVPNDNDEKIRVCRYQVLAENPDKRTFGRIVTLEEILGTEVKEKPVSVPTPAPAASSAVYPDGSRIPEYKTLISDLIKFDPNMNLKRYKNKKITAGRRTEFEAAANELGFKL